MEELELSLGGLELSHVGRGRQVQREGTEQVKSWRAREGSVGVCPWSPGLGCGRGSGPLARELGHATS